jgi:sec-independent protein translocase protein TatA
MGIGKIEVILLIALLITLLFVGGKKLPELARGLGESVKEIKKGFRDDDRADPKIDASAETEQTTIEKS